MSDDARTAALEARIAAVEAGLQGTQRKLYERIADARERLHRADGRGRVKRIRYPSAMWEEGGAQ